MRANAPQLPGGGGMGAAGIDWCIILRLLYYLDVIAYHGNNKSSETPFILALDAHDSKTNSVTPLFYY